MLYKVVKKLWAEFLLAAFGTFLLLPQELQEVRTKASTGFGTSKRLRNILSQNSNGSLAVA
jgi:hypothetical protein